LGGRGNLDRERKSQMDEYENAEDGSPLQELTQKIKDFIAEEADGQPHAFVLDALMNAMIHIASDARPDVTIPTILDFLMDDLKSYQAAAQEMVASGDILPAHPLDQFIPKGPKQ
jgi:hypothetical protein